MKLNMMFFSAKWTTLLRKTGLALVLLFISVTVMGQLNPFRAANIASITASEDVSGDINSLTNGNTNAFDYIDLYAPADTDQITIQFQLVNAETLIAYDFYFYSADYASRGITISGSQNGTSWTTLNLKTGAAAIMSASFSNTTAYKYYKFSFEGINNGSRDLSPTEVIGYSNQFGPIVLNAVPGTLSSQAVLTWDPITLGGTDNGIVIERSLNGTDFAIIDTVPQTTVTYTDNGLARNTKYWYRIKGYTGMLVTPYSDIKEITTGDDVLRTAPTLTSVALTGTQITHSWSLNIPGAGGFELEKSLDGTTFTLFATFDKTKTTFTEESLTPITKYWYRLRGYNEISKSPYSNITEVTTTDVTASPADITNDGGRLFVSADNPGGANAGEGSSKFIDNNYVTKWLIFNGEAPGSLSAVYKPTGSYVVTGYTLTTANDAPGRDPRNWQFFGSNDSTNWVTLDTRTNQLGQTADRFKTFSFALANAGTVAYKFYRILFTANNGANDGVRFQIGEWEIMGLDANSPTLPSGLTVSATTTTSVSLQWQGGGTVPAASYTLQRSIDGINFTTIAASLPATPLTYTDTNLADSMVYYYRVQAKGVTPTAVTGWSNVAKALTKFENGKPIAPVDLTVTNAVDSIVSLKWTDRSYNETGYTVQRSVDKINFKAVASLAANTTTFNDSTVWPATQYYYRVQGSNAAQQYFFSNIDSAITPGFNRPPALTAPNVERYVCNTSGEYNFTISNITGGPGNEKSQSLKVVNITADSAHFFTNMVFNANVVNGVAQFGFKGTGLASYGDTAVIKLTVQDDGGVQAFGVDSAVVELKIVYLPLTVSIKANTDDIMNTPQYRLVQLTAVTNLPSQTRGYNWLQADGIVGSTNNMTLMVQPTKPTEYTVTAKHSSGCEATASITLAPVNNRNIANVLTPNGDGKNDRWIIWGITTNTNNNVKVYDRAGRLVYSKNNYDNTWDGTVNGKKLEEGAYIYYVNFGDGSKVVSGTLTVIH
jgi:gliding motility-associated-like protein